MGYAVELSFDIRKLTGITKRHDELSCLADRFNCSCFYSTYEAEGVGGRISRSESIHVVMFDENDGDNVIDFVKDVRKCKLAYIDCVYRDDYSCDLLYASPKYLKLLDKPTSLKVRRNLRERSKSEEFTANIKSAVQTSC